MNDGAPEYEINTGWLEGDMDVVVKSVTWPDVGPEVLIFLISLFLHLHAHSSRCHLQMRPGPLLHRLSSR